MQKLQTELKVQMKFASQATPSPRAKATMESLDHAKSELIINYDSVVQSLKQLNRINRNRNSNDGNGNLTTNEKYPEDKPVDKEVQNRNHGENKKGKSYNNLLHSIFYNKIFSYSHKYNLIEMI